MSHYPGPGYGQPFPPSDGGVSDGPADRPVALGVIGLVLVVITIVVVIVISLRPTVMMPTVGPYPSASDSMDQLSASGFLSGNLLILMTSGAIGLAGWIIGIVATVTNRGRAFGIAAIVVGAIAPIIAAMMMFGALLIKAVG